MFAVFVVPVYEAEIVTLVVKTTRYVYTVNVALLAPAGMVMLANRSAAE